MDYTEIKSIRGNRIQVVNFNGLEYRRYPDSTSKPAARYFYPYEKGNRALGKPCLHVAVWEHHHGPVPKDYHIHHKDKGFEDNSIENLEMLSRKEHGARHRGDDMERKVKQMDYARKFASEWHGSEEGLAWHSEHGKHTWDNREREKLIVCVECGKESLSYFGDQPDLRFCSRVCTNRYNHRTKRYHETRTCIVCGNSFIIKKSLKQQSCSRKCSWVIRRDVPGGK